MLHRSMRGRPIDMAKLAKENERTVAVGNAHMNARGDIIGMGGRVIERAEERAQMPLRKEAPANIKQQSSIDPKFFEASQAKNYEDVDFKTPEEVMRETQKWAKDNKKRKSETPPQAPRHTKGHIGKKPSANAPDVVEEDEPEKQSRRRSSKKEDTSDDR